MKEESKTAADDSGTEGKNKADAPKSGKKKPAAKKKTGAKSRIPKLSEVQQTFVEEKIKALGSLSAVENFYALDDKVSKYARLRALALFGKS